ncbi:MAG TPA: PVC-type heme-binding CxxCH protein [Planctomycetota bacterium]|nr:PVC-type heme-binding CxxCH protein [Planctomycetota bacterium]
MQILRFILLSSLLAVPLLHAADAVPDPEEERRSFVVADGFEVNLFASDPQMAKPINMNFDPQGRLWVASSETYPQVKPGEVPNDKIIVLEDTKGAGRADKVTVFADHLFIPTGIVPGDGGVYVANSTQILHLKDTDGDGKADVKRIVLDGFGTEDTHHIIHTFRWGMDGCLYFNQSVYIHTNMETPYGVQRLNAGGTWRFNPTTLKAEVFSQGMVNHWGHVFTKWGESLMTDGAYGEGVNFAFPGATFFWAKDLNQRDPQRILRGMSVGQPKYASIELISGRHFPDDWQGDVITNDFRASRIVRFKLSEEGSGYSAKLMPDVIHVGAGGSGNGNERVFRPIDVKMGPDGALYIADWFNPIIQHGEVDFRDPRRDHTHGRIWRLTAKGRPLVERPKLIDASVAELLKQFEAPEQYTRAQARRVLIEKGAAKVIPGIVHWREGAMGEAPPTEWDHLKLEALWLYQAFNTPHASLLRGLLASSDPHARAAATRVLRDCHARIPDALDLLTNLIADESPRVRLEAICTLEAIPEQRSLEIALRALDKPMDANIDFALFHACNALKQYWLPGVENGSYAFGGNMRALAYALQAAGSRAGVAPLLALLKDGKIAAENQESVLGIIGGLGGPGELTELFKLQEKSDAATRAKILNALLRAANERHAKPDGDLAAIKKLFEGGDVEASAAIRLAGAWKEEGLRDTIRVVLANAGPPLKLAALDAIAALGGPKSIAVLAEFANSNARKTLRAHAAANLVPLEAPTAVPPAAALLAEPLDASAVEELFAAFARKEGAGAKLANALEAGKLAPENASAGLRYFNASGQNEPQLIALLKKSVEAQAAVTSTSPEIAGKKPAEMAAQQNADEKKILNPDDMKALIAEVQTKGDPARGEKVFRRSTLSCFSCHAIGGAGGQVGPDLSNVGAASQLDYIIDSVLSPNKTVKEGYNSWNIITKNKEHFAGNIVRETATHLILRDGTHDEILIPLSDIDRNKMRPAGSLMPNGLADSLTRGEFVDLIRFLSELGKPGPFSTAQSVAVRKFRVHPVSEALAKTDSAGVPKLLAEMDAASWIPAYANLAGGLSKEELRINEKSTAALVQFELNVTAPGDVVINSPAGDVKLWLDGIPIEQGKIAVQKGIRTFTLRTDPQRADGFSGITVVESPANPAHFQRVGGK